MGVVHRKEVGAAAFRSYTFKMQYIIRRVKEGGPPPPAGSARRTINECFTRGGSRISEKGELLVNFMVRGRESEEEPLPPTLFHYIMRITS